MVSFQDFQKGILLTKSKKIIIVGGIISLALVLALITGLVYYAQQIKKAENPPPPQLIKTFIVEGDSMEPTLKNGQEIKVDLIYYRLNEIKKGDIVALEINGKYYIKRVIAVPKDKLELKEGKIFINDQPLKEEYLKDPNYRLTEEELTMVLAVLKNYGSPFIPQDMVFVLSDNRSAKLDSRNFGLIPTPLIKGKLISY